MKYLTVILSTFFFIASCSHETKEIVFRKTSNTNFDLSFLNTNTKQLTGQIKSAVINGNVYLLYKLSHQYDTTGNKLLDQNLFLGEPLNYGRYSSNLDSLDKQVSSEAKKEEDSLQMLVDENKKNDTFKSKNGKPSPSSLILKFQLERFNLSLTRTSEYAAIIKERISEAKRLKTYPNYYHNPYFKSRNPSFNVSYTIKLIDKDEFEIISYITGEHKINPFVSNISKGKIPIEYKKPLKFNDEVFSKARKVIIEISKANQ